MILNIHTWATATVYKEDVDHIKSVFSRMRVRHIFTDVGDDYDVKLEVLAQTCVLDEYVMNQVLEILYNWFNFRIEYCPTGLEDAGFDLYFDK